MSSSLLPLLDQALTELEALEKRLEAGHISDARHWPSLSLSIRKLASTSVELVNMTETRNRTNRAQMISFCARMKTIALIFHETIATREIRNVPVFPTPGSGKIARIGKTPSSGRVAQASIAASRDTEALLMPDLKLLISKLANNAPELVEFEWTHVGKLGPQGVSAVVEPLNWRNTFLRVLKLSNQQLGDLGVSYVAKSMKSNRTIEVLDISGNSVTSKGVECLVDALLWNEGRFVIGGVVEVVAPGSSSSIPTSPLAATEIHPHTTVSRRGGSALRHLDISHNLIDFSGCGHIARLVTNAESITTLLLNNNLLNDVGLTTIANALALNCSLSRLDLQFNPASQNVSVGPIFANVLESSNYTLTSLDLGGSRVSDGDMILIQSSLHRNALLREERLSSIEHASPRENAFKRMEVGKSSNVFSNSEISSTSSQPTSTNPSNAARLHIFHADVLSPAAILRLVVTPLGANIVSLVMTDCNLTKLPPQLCLLGTHLENLDVRRNKLTALPLEIRGFFKLKRLHLAHNFLQHLPPQLTSLNSLDAISLQGNPLQWTPQDVVNHAEIEDFPPADTRLFKFLQEASEHTDTPDNTAYGKIMILGQVHSGKTSLCQILDSTFGAEVQSQDGPSIRGDNGTKEGWSHEMPRYISTEGVCARNIVIQGSKYFASEPNVSPLYAAQSPYQSALSSSGMSSSQASGSVANNLNASSASNSSDRIVQIGSPASMPAVYSDNSAVTRRANFLVLEAGGSQIYSSAHSIFFRQDLLYLVTVDLTKLSPDQYRDTLNELKTTIQTIRTMVGTHSPKIALVGTFEDLLPSPQALMDAMSLLKMHFDPYVLEIFSISNKSSRGLSILRDRVLFWTLKTRLLSSPALGCISTIARVLKSYSRTRPFISSAELEQIARVYGVEQAPEVIGPALSPRFGSSETQSMNSSSGANSLTSSKMSVKEAIKILENIGAVTMFHNDPQLECYAFIDIQFIANVFSDIMASADADGYIYRSRVPPLLWMDCRRHASMKSLFDWCRLFGLALDCGDTHYIVPSLLNFSPNSSIFNAAWPPMENIDGISSRPHMTSPRRMRLVSPTPSGGMKNSNLNFSSTSAQYGASPTPSLAYSPTSSPPPTISYSPPSTHARGSLASQNSIQSPSPTVSSASALLHAAVTSPPGTVRLSPAQEKTVRGYHREMSQVACNEWPVLVRGIAADFVPSLIFSHIMIAVFSLPLIQRCAWWKNGFVVRRGTSFVKVTKEGITQGGGIFAGNTSAPNYSQTSSKEKKQSSDPNSPSITAESQDPTTANSSKEADPSIGNDSSTIAGENSAGNGPNNMPISDSSVKILVEARNDTTYTHSKELLEEICNCIDLILQRWYPQFEYRWAVTWSHPWLLDEETPALSLLQVKDALSRGPIRTATQVGQLTIREELLMPELVSHASFYTKISNLIELKPEEHLNSAHSSEALLFQTSSPRIAQIGPQKDLAETVSDEEKKKIQEIIKSHPPKACLQPIIVSNTSVSHLHTGLTTSSANTRLLRDPADGSIVRFREIPENALPSTALTLSVLRNERIATLHGVYGNPSGITIHMPKGGTLNDCLERTYNDAPLPWAARFRIAVDIVLALRYIHSQVPVMALQGLDAHSVLLNDFYSDPLAAGSIARIDMTATNSQYWLNSIYAPMPFLPSASQLATISSNQNSSNSSGSSNTAPHTSHTVSSFGGSMSNKLSPHASDIYSLGVILLQLWRNEPLEDLITRVRDKLPPVPYYAPDSPGLYAYEQLIAACVCDDPMMRPQIDGVITKLHAISVHLNLPSTTKLLAAHEPSRRWRKIKTVQISSGSTDMSFAISALCKSSSSTFQKMNTTMPASTVSSGAPGSTSTTTSAFLASLSASRSPFFDETIVWAGGVDGVLYGMPFSMANIVGGASYNADSVSLKENSKFAKVSGASGAQLSTISVHSSSSNYVSSSLGPSLSQTTSTSISSASQNALQNSSSAAKAYSSSMNSSLTLSSLGTMQSLHWSTLSTSVLDSASVQYRMTTFSPETRRTRRRIIATATSTHHIWCLLNTVTAAVLDPARIAVVAQVEVGACLSIAAHQDLVFTGGTNGLLSVFDGTSCKKLRQREISKLPITAIAANNRFVWCALTDDPGMPSTLVCLDAKTLQEETRYSHSEEDTITSICITPAAYSSSTSNDLGGALSNSNLGDSSNSNFGLSLASSNSSSLTNSSSTTVVNGTAEIMWTGGYSGSIFTFKLNRSPFIDSSDVTIVPHTTHRNIHKTRILSFLWNGDFVYSASNDSIAAWKIDAEETASHLALPTNDISSFTTLEKNCLIIGHKNGSVSIWASV